MWSSVCLLGGQSLAMAGVPGFLPGNPKGWNPAVDAPYRRPDFFAAFFFAVLPADFFAAFFLAVLPADFFGDFFFPAPFLAADFLAAFFVLRVVAALTPAADRCAF